MCLFDVNMMENLSYVEVTGVGIIMVLKMVEQIKTDYDIDGYVKMIVKKFKLDRRTLKEKINLMH